MAADALDRLIATIEEHYGKENPSSLLLSSFGQKNKDLLAELKENFG